VKLQREMNCRHRKVPATVPADAPASPHGALSPRAGALLLVAVAMEVGYLGMFRLANLKQHVETFIPLMLLEGILYFVSVYIAEKIFPRRSHLVFVFLAAAAFRLTLFPLYPTLSDDLIRYRWEGRAQQAGYNPYTVRPSDPAMAVLRDETYPSVAGPEYSTLYGPLAEELLWADYVLLRKVVAMKLPFVLLDLAVVLVLFRWLPILGVSPLRAIVYAWSPLTVVEFSGSGHSDPLSILALVLALFLYRKSWPRLSVGALAAAALAKIYAAFLLPVFLFRTSWRYVVIPVILGFVAFAPYGERWGDLFRGLSEYGQHWTNNESLYRLIRPLAANAAYGGRIYLAVVATAVFYCVWRKFEPERATFAILGTILLFSPNVFPWYFAWVLPLLAIDPNPAWLLLTITSSLSYHVLIPYGILGLWQEDPYYAVLEYVPFFCLWIGGYVAAKVRAAAGSE
jgi:glycosyl transferase family 87